MQTFDLITFFLGLIFGLILLIWFFINLYKNRKNKSFLIKTGIRVLILSAIVIVPFQFMNSDFGKSIHESYRKNYTTSTTYVLSDSSNYEAQLIEVILFKQFIESRTRHINRPVSDFINEPHSQDIINKYAGFKLSEDSTIHDIGYLFTAFHYVNLELDFRLVDNELSEIYDTNIPYYHYVKGTNQLNRHSWNSLSSSESHLLKSIELNECVSDSYENLSYLYYYFHEHEKLNALIDNPETTNYIPEWPKRIRYFKENNWIDYWKVRLKAEFDYWHIMSVSSALVLLLLWLHYLRKLDIYEPEKKRYLILTFFISIVSMQLLYPMHDVLWNVFDYHRPLRPISDLWYCVISIGMIEEMVKIIPVLIMLRFTKQINEPFDYILYAAVSALGFAFIENIGYIGENISNVSIRGIYCCVAHMAFSATIGYGLMLAKYRGYNKYLMFTIFFVLASFLHGFYDFWIMDWWATQYNWMSDLIFLFCIYLFGYFVNNTLNNTTFYNKEVLLERAKLRFLVIAICITIIMTGFVALCVYYPIEYVKMTLFGNFVRFNFYICFLAITMGSMKIIKGYVSPIPLPLNNLFKSKRKMLDLSGRQLQLSTSAKFKIETEHLSNASLLNQEALLKERTTVNDNLNAYTLELTEAIDAEGYESNLLLAIPHWDKGNFMSRKKTLTNVYLIKEGFNLDQPFLSEDDFTYVGKIFTTPIN
ncbi:MAG: PrsW family intramembrane metalloprotease [Crocinitomicaceae bacterium]